MFQKDKQNSEIFYVPSALLNTNMPQTACDLYLNSIPTQRQCLLNHFINIQLQNNAPICLQIPSKCNLGKIQRLPHHGYLPRDQCPTAVSRDNDRMRSAYN
jgi:hypothetical protein